MPTILEKSISDKANPIFVGQLCQIVAIFFEQSIFLGLEVPHLLVRDDLSNKQENPSQREEIVDSVERAQIRGINRRGEPLDEDVLIVGDKEEVEKLYQYPMIVLANVDPTIIFSSFREPSLSEEVIGQSRSPKSDHCQHYDLPRRNRVCSAVMLMIQVECPMENRQDRPETIDPRILASGDIENQADSTDDQTAHHTIMDSSCFAVIGVRES